MGMLMFKCPSKYGAHDSDWDTGRTGNVRLPFPFFARPLVQCAEQNTNDLPSMLWVDDQISPRKVQPMQRRVTAMRPQ